MIHPRVSILAKAGPIVIGENCLIEEYTTIINDVDESDPDRPKTLVIGSNNVFEVGCTIEASKIGEKNLFECKSSVGKGVEITSNCIIGAGCQVKGRRTLPENTIVHGPNCSERELLEKSGVSRFNIYDRSSSTNLFRLCFQSHSLQLTFLRKLLPSYHFIRKANIDPKKSKVAV